MCWKQLFLAFLAAAACRQRSWTGLKKCAEKKKRKVYTRVSNLLFVSVPPKTFFPLERVGSIENRVRLGMSAKLCTEGPRADDRRS